MIKYCLNKWNTNYKRLESALKNDRTLNNCEYSYLVKLVVDYVLNDEKHTEWDSSKITVVDNGDYLGTQLFLIPMNTYAPGEFEYLMTYVGYGSCSGCDTLLRIQDWNAGVPTSQQLEDYMKLCKDLITNMILPYNNGWRHDSDFDTVTME